MRLNRDTIILIGPLGTGKSHFAKILSELTGMKNYPIDKLKWYYRFKNGYDLNKSTDTLMKGGFPELINYAKNYFGINELQQILNEFHGIIDLGASDTFCTDSTEFSKIQNLLSTFDNVFLILPYKEDEKTLALLRRRLVERYKFDKLKAPILDSYLNLNQLFVKSKNNKLLAKHIIYTDDRCPKEVTLEIISKVKRATLSCPLFIDK
jgi:hypothetical protein